ncbi:MAG: HEAT repeat domain-containing protein [bacterium]|nr:MAG: HEAT repeat domain-containing protein [bacterium]
MNKNTVPFLFLIIGSLAAVLTVAAGAGSRYASLLASQEGHRKLATLAGIEESRILTVREIEPFSLDPHPLIRLRTAEVLGRIADPAGIPILVRLTGDSDPAVAETAVFALGLTGGREAIEPLGAALAGGGRNIKARALEALGRTRMPEAGKHIIPHLTSFHSSLRIEAALALAVLGDSISATACVKTLHDPDPQVIAAGVYTLGRIGVRNAGDRIAPLIFHERAEVRMRAVEAMGRLDVKAAVEPIGELIPDEDRFVTIKAAEALGRIGGSRSARILRALLTSPNSYIRSVALEGIASIKDKGSYDAVLPLIKDTSQMVRRAALRAAASCGREKAREHLLAAYREGTLIERAAALELLGGLSDPGDLALLVEVLATHEEQILRGAAATGLGRWQRHEELARPDATGGGTGRPLDALLEAAAGDDWVVASIALETLGKIGSTGIIPDLVHVYEVHNERIDSDRRLEAIRAIVSIGMAAGEGQCDTTVIFTFLARATRDPDPRLAREAADAAGELGITIEPVPAAEWRRGTLPWGEPALPLGERRIVITTGRGEIEVVLFGDDAPNIVMSILGLAFRGFYDGLTFHRVVPGFVIQGGCPRGDGWGDAGYFLRSQFNLHRYERGMVGMAHAGKDTPGSQIFITHTPQPHLNGRYTIVGKVVGGMDVVDRIEVGDTFNIRLID